MATRILLLPLAENICRTSGQSKREMGEDAYLDRKSRWGVEAGGDRPRSGTRELTSRE